MIDMEVIRAISDAAGQVTRRGRDWLAGTRVLSRSDVGRLYRAGMLSGRRGSPTYLLTPAAQRALKVARSRFPETGSRVTFRDTSYRSQKAHRYVDGHVVANSPRGWSSAWATRCTRWSGEGPTAGGRVR